MRIGLFFGSFNPIHVGHLVIAEHLATRSDLDEVWLVVSPQNPLKQKSTLAPDYDRLHLVELAIADNPKLRASNVEFKLPRPSYTVDTLAFLREQRPADELVLIMGGDNLATLHKWKNYEVILRDYAVYVYNRPTHTRPELADHPSVRYVEAPLMDISSSAIRRGIAAGQSVRYLLTEPVHAYLQESHLYRT